jgi:hypothetical protein
MTANVIERHFWNWDSWIVTLELNLNYSIIKKISKHKVDCFFISCEVNRRIVKP